METAVSVLFSCRSADTKVIPTANTKKLSFVSEFI
jgi:hypothetical protein